MRESRPGWALVLCVLAFATAFGCGSEDTKSDTDTTSSSVATSGGRAGGGAAADEVKIRMNVTSDECMVQTLGIFALRPDGYSSDCVSCLCAESPTTVAQCDDQADKCWGLISCSGKNCSDMQGIDAANCAISMCGQFIEGAGLAMSVGALLQGSACSAKCPSTSGK